MPYPKSTCDTYTLNLPTVCFPFFKWRYWATLNSIYVSNYMRLAWCFFDHDGPERAWGVIIPLAPFPQHARYNRLDHNCLINRSNTFTCIHFYVFRSDVISKQFFQKGKNKTITKQFFIFKCVNFLCRTKWNYILICRRIPNCVTWFELKPK